MRGLARDHLTFWLGVAFLAFTIALSLFIYLLSYRHYALCFPLLVAFVWITWARIGEAPPAAVRIWAGVLAIGGVASLLIGIFKPFSSAAAIADWIERNGEQETLFLHASKVNAMELAPIVRGSLGIGEDCLQTFAIFRAPALSLPRDEPVTSDKLRILGPGRDQRRAQARCGRSRGARVALNRAQSWQLGAGSRRSFLSAPCDAGRYAAA